MRVLTTVLVILLFISSYCMAEESSPSESRETYDLEKWEIKEEVDIVNKALQVYKNKSKPVYNKKLWIIDKEDGTKRIIAEYKTSKEHDRIVFSPGEDYAFYLAVAPTGDTVVYGWELSSGDQYFIDYADNFEMMNCDNNKEYIVIEKDEGEIRYYIYDANGNNVRVFEGLDTQEVLEEAVCY